MARQTRKRRRRARVAEPEAPQGFPQWEHGSFTFEGEIERLGAISRNMSTAPRWTRIVARVVVLLFLLPLVVGLVIYVAGLFTR